MTDPLGLPPDTVKAALSPFGTVETPRGLRHGVTVEPARLREALSAALVSLRLDHFIQLATIDTGDAFEVRYILTGPHRAVVTLKTRVPHAAAHLPSVFDILAPAGLYERQTHDLFGIVFDGHPSMARLVLSEDWPEGVFPLRKSFKVEGEGRPARKEVAK